MATIWKDARSAKPVWCLKYKSLDGRWRRERTDARTKEEAQALLGKKLGELTKAELVGARTEAELERRPFARYVQDEYMKHCALHHKPSTIETDRDFERVVVPHFGARELRSISQGDIIRWLEKVAVGRSPATVNRYRTWLSGVFSEAARRGYVTANPCKGIRKLREPAAKERYLSADEERRLLAECAPWLAFVVRLGLHSGLRLSELLRLAWGDVSLERRQIHVRETKSGRDRHVPINETLLALMKVQRALAADADPVVRWGDGARRSDEASPTDNAVQVAFGAAMKRARVERFRFHDLRHTFASRLVQRGVSLQVVKELLGHQTMAMVLRYAHLSPANLAASVAVLDQPAGARQDGTPVVQIGLAK